MAKKNEVNGAIDWAQFSLESDPAYAAAVAARAKLAARTTELEAEIRDFQAKARLISPTTARQKKAAALLAEAEGGVATVDGDELDEAVQQERIAELAAVQDAIVLAQQKVQHEGVMAGRVLRQKLSPYRAAIVDRLRVAVVHMLEGCGEMAAFENGLSQCGIVTAGPWREVCLHNLIGYTLETWLAEFDKTGFMEKNV